MNTSIWIDHHKAYIFNYQADGIHENEIKAHDSKNSEHLKKFYHEVAQKIENAENVLIMGPGMAKDEFKHHCEDHHPKLKKAIKKVQSMKDHPSKDEMLAASNKFFKEFHSFAGL